MTSRTPRRHAPSHVTALIVLLLIVSSGFLTGLLSALSADVGPEEVPGLTDVIPTWLSIPVAVTGAVVLLVSAIAPQVASPADLKAYALALSAAKPVIGAFVAGAGYGVVVGWAGKANPEDDRAWWLAVGAITVSGLLLIGLIKVARHRPQFFEAWRDQLVRKAD